MSLRLLEAGVSPVRRWNEQGEATVYSAETDGVDKHLHAKLADPDKLGTAISSLIESKHVYQDSTEDRTVSIFPETVAEQEKLLLEQNKLQYWRKKGCTVR